jgi:integrase
MVSIRKRWFNLKCPECRRPGLKRRGEKFHCGHCGKLVHRNKSAYYKWTIDYVDMHGHRHLETCPRSWSKKQVRERAAELEKDPGGNPHILFETVVKEWLSMCEAKVKSKRLRPQSLEDYRRKLRHAIDIFGQRKIKSIKRAMILDFLVSKLNEGLSGRTVSEIRGRLHALFQFALAREYLSSNPIIGITRDLALTPASSAATVRAFSEEQRVRFLDAAVKEDAEIYPLLFALDRTGLRIGEATALKPGDVDLGKRDLHIRRTWVRGGLLQEKPKSKAGLRTIDMSIELTDMLAGIMRDRISPWLFIRNDGRHWTQSMVQKQFRKILTAAKLPTHFSPHSFRHTYAVRALEAGCSLEWLQRQLGHEDLRITNDLYGRSARISDKAQADRLDNGHATCSGS